MCDPRGSSFILPHRSSIFHSFCQRSLSGLLQLTGLTNLQRSDCRAADLAVFAAARHFCSAKILAGGLRWGWGPRRSRQRHRPRKEISRGNLLCAKSGLTNLSYPRLESAQKYVTTLDKRILNTGQPRGARGTAVPFVSGGVQRNPFQGVPLGNFFLTVDAVLLCAAKKNGVETYQAGRVLPVNPWSLDHGSSKKATCCGAGSIPKNMQKPQKPCSCKYIPLMLYCG